MDGKKFDELTKALSERLQRRTLLKGVVAAAAAGVAKVTHSTTVEAQCIQYGRRCSGSSTCCGGGACTGGICRCPAGTQTCKNTQGTQCIAPCPPDQVRGSNCRCLCRTSGHPPVNGVCPCFCDGPYGPVECCAGECCADDEECTDLGYGLTCNPIAY